MAAKHLTGDAPDELPGQGGTGGGGGTLPDGNYGDITVSGGGTSLSINTDSVGSAEIAAGAVGTTELAADAVSNDKLANMPTLTFKGRAAAGTGDPADLTATQATGMLDTFTSSLKGLAPASGGGSTNFLRADGTWAVPSGGGGGGSVPTATAVCLLRATAAGQSFNYVSGVPRQLTLQTVLSDPANVYNTSTGRYTPNVAGYYHIDAGVYGSLTSSVVVSQVRVNGALVISGSYVPSSSASGGQLSVASGIVFLNGTTDYVELWARSSITGTATVGGGDEVYLSCRLVAI